MARLEQRDAIRVQMLINLFLARITSPFRKSYNEFMTETLSSSALLDNGKQSKQIARSDEGTLAWRPSKTRPKSGKTFWLKSGRLRALFLRKRLRNSITTSTKSNCVKRISVATSGKLAPALVKPEEALRSERLTHAGCTWNWQLDCIPQVPKILLLFGRLSSCWMAYAVIRVFLHPQLSALIGSISEPVFSIAGNCFLIGRLISHPIVANTDAALFSCSHLIWRAVQTYCKRSYKLTMIIFLFLSEADLALCYEFVEREQRANVSTMQRSSGGRRQQASDNGAMYSDYFLLLRQSPSLRRSFEFGASAKRRSTLSASKNEDLSSATTLSVQSGNFEVAAVEQCARVKLIEHAMCYRVRFKNQTLLRLKPNRTRLALGKLCKHAARCTIIATSIMIVLIFSGGLYVLATILSDLHYVNTYPGCRRDLDELHAAGNLKASDMTLGAHRLISGLADCLENSLIWLDSGFSITFVPLLAYLLNYDILLYRAHLELKLKHLLALTRLCNSVKLQLIYQTKSLTFSASLHTGNNNNCQQQVNAIRNKSSKQARQQVSATWSWKLLNELHDELALGYCELQYEMYDFFKEVGRVDLLVSDILTASILIWFMAIAFVDYNFLVRNNTRVPYFIQFIIFVGFAEVATSSFFLLALRRGCLRNYTLLCSIMAENQSREKRRFIKLLEYFTQQLHRTTYSLLQSHPYQPTTFISIIGWCFSCLSISITLFGSGEVVSDAGECAALDNCTG